jgi:hypothetical protein
MADRSRGNEVVLGHGAHELARLGGAWHVREAARGKAKGEEARVAMHDVRERAPCTARHVSVERLGSEAMYTKVV